MVFGGVWWLLFKDQMLARVGIISLALGATASVARKNDVWFPKVSEIGKAFAKSWSRYAVVVGFSACGILAIEDSDFAYPSLILCGVGATAWCFEKWPKIWVRPLGALLVATWLFVFGWNDTVRQSWDKDESHYHDTRHRWSDRLLARAYSEYKTSDHIHLVYYASGPMAGTGKQHGEWTHELYDDSRILPIDTETAFYWYGEEVSEGEWHRRNKR